MMCEKMDAAFGFLACPQIANRDSVSGLSGKVDTAQDY